MGCQPSTLASHRRTNTGDVPRLGQQSWRTGRSRRSGWVTRTSEPSHQRRSHLQTVLDVRIPSSRPQPRRTRARHQHLSTFRLPQGHRRNQSEHERQQSKHDAPFAQAGTAQTRKTHSSHRSRTLTFVHVSKLHGPNGQQTKRHHPPKVIAYESVLWTCWSNRCSIQ